MVSLKPFRSNVALVAVMRTGARSERHSFAASRRVPALRFNRLVNVLLPPKTKTPAPLLLSAPAPLMTPLSVLVKPVPALNTAVPVFSTTFRTETNEAEVVKVALVLNVKVPAASPRAASEPTVMVPAAFVVPPRYVLVPVKVRASVPILVNAPGPLMVPESVSVVPPALMTPPLAPREMGRTEVNVTLVVSVPPFNVRLPLVFPKLLSAAMLMAPAVMVVPPV